MRPRTRRAALRVLVGVAPLALPTAAGAQRPAAPAPAASVTLSLRGVTPADALDRLAAASGMSLVADAALLERAAARGRRVFCRADAMAAEALLRCIVREAGLDFYRLSSGTYVVVARAELPAEGGALAGVMLDAATGAPLPHGRLLLAEHGRTRTANDAGVVTFVGLAPGRYRLVATALGYDPAVAEVDVAADGATRARLPLRRAPLVVAPVVVNGLVPIPGDGRLGADAATLDGDAVARAMAVAGPSFLVQGAPGLIGVAQRAALGDLHIQGGESGEHQLRLDGMPIFDPVSLGRLQGALSPLAIARLTVHKAGFGAGVGSYTAGVVDLEHTLGEAERASAALQLDAGSASARLTAPGRVGGARVHGMLAARASLWDVWRAPGVARTLDRWNAVDPVLAQRLGGATALAGRVAGPTALDFGDLHAAARAQVGAFRSWRASAYVGRSAIGTEVRAVPSDTIEPAPPAAARMLGDAYRWRTEAAQLRHDWLLGARAAHMVRVRASRHTLDHRWMLGATSAADPGAHDGNRVDEVALESTLDASVGAAWTVVAGAELARTASRVAMTNPLMLPVNARRARARGTAHVQLGRALGARRRLELGVRATTLGGGAGSGPVYLEPRVALRADGEGGRLGPWAWRVAAGEYRQFVVPLDVAVLGPSALVPSVRLWLPTDAATGVPRARHLALEGVLAPRPGWSVRGEAYAKALPTLLAFDYAALLPERAPSTGSAAGGAADGAPPAPAFAARASGRAYGAGVRVARAGAAGRVEAGYDWGQSTRTFPSRFDGARQPTPWNEPHRALLALDVAPTAIGGRVPRGLQLSLRARGIWGRTWALRPAYYDLLTVHSAGAGLPIGRPGAAARPAVYELDAGVTWQRALANGYRVEVGASVLNLLDRRNVLDYSLVPRVDGAASGTDGVEYVRTARPMLGAQPTLVVRIGR